MFNTPAQLARAIHQAGWRVSATPADPEITAIVAQQVHIVQPIERVHGKLVVFGEGQLLSNQSSACCPVQTQDGMLVFLHLTVTRRSSRLSGITYMPTWDRHRGYTIPGLLGPIPNRLR